MVHSWVETDCDYGQHKRYRPDLGNGVFEFIQINEYPSFFKVVQAIIYPKDYNMLEVGKILQQYGHKDIQGFIDDYDGNFDWSLIAEMIFETESQEYESAHEFKTFEDAKEYVKSIVEY